MKKGITHLWFSGGDYFYAVVSSLLSGIFFVLWCLVWFILYWGLTPQQQTRSYRDGDYGADDGNTGGGNWSNEETVRNERLD